MKMAWTVILVVIFVSSCAATEDGSPTGNNTPRQNTSTKDIYERNKALSTEELFQTNEALQRLMAKNSADNVAASTEVSYDRHQGVTTIKSPEVVAFGEPYHFMRGWVRRDAPPMAQIYVRVELDDWAFLDRAYSEGRQLDFTQINSEVGNCGRNGCTLHEHVGVNLTMDELRAIAAQDRPFEFQVAGRGGSAEASVPAGYVQGFLRRLDEAVQAGL